MLSNMTTGTSSFMKHTFWHLCLLGGVIPQARWQEWSAENTGVPPLPITYQVSRQLQATELSGHGCLLLAFVFPASAPQAI